MRHLDEDWPDPEEDGPTGTTERDLEGRGADPDLEDPLDDLDEAWEEDSALAALMARPNPVVDPIDREAVARVLDRLARGELTVVGQLMEASNAVFLGLLADPDGGAGADDGGDPAGPGRGDGPWRVVYKPTRGERPLRDFPPGTLAHREVAAFAVSHEGGWGVVPPTVLREGPLGPGAVQLWVDHDEDAVALVDVVPPEQVAPGWLPVFAGETPDGQDVVVVHRDDATTARFAAYDCVVNNADRKGSHVLLDPTGRAWGIDHGITLHAEPKLRTVLWGWVGDPLPEAERERLTLLQPLLADPASALLRGHGPQAGLDDLLAEDEVQALRDRVAHLLDAGTFPQPDPGHYPIPWPPL